MIKTKLHITFIFCSCLIVFIHTLSFGQDYIFSQNQVSQLYYNPAYAGNTDLLSAAVIQKVQWPYEETVTSATCLIIDYVPRLKNSGIAFSGTTGYDAVSKESINTLGVSFSYGIKITEDLIAKAGLEASYFNMHYGGDLIFGDQYAPNGELIQSETDETIGDNSVNKLDFSAGLFTAYKSKTWFGISASHLSRPNISLIEGHESRLPLFWNINAGYIFYLDKSVKDRTFLMPTLNWFRQAGFSQWSLGGYFLKSPLLIGIWYKGNPFDSYEEIRQHQSVSIHLGLLLKVIRVEYSYDIDLSELQQTGGAHELSLSYELPWEGYRKKMNTVKGPKW